MLGTQLFAKILNPSHPAHSLSSPDPSPRDKKNIPAKYFLSQLPYSHTLSHPSQDAIAEIHTHFVSSTLNSLPPNKVLNSCPPEIHPLEASLPRRLRCSLSQLRCGFSPLLRSYLHRINKSPTDLCRFCHSDPETTTHLFEICPSLSPLRLTYNITPLTLWRDPARAAEFLEASGICEPHH